MIDLVALDSQGTADQIRAYLADYGETLAELSEQAWKTSVSQWMGTYWEVLVDLWTAESGPSDLVLGARVFSSVMEVVHTLDRILVQYGTELTDQEYIEKPEWTQVLQAARRALDVLGGTEAG